MSTNEFYPFDDTPENEGEENRSDQNAFDDNFGLPEVPSTQSFFNEDEEDTSSSSDSNESTFDKDYNFQNSGNDNAFGSSYNFGTDSPEEEKQEPVSAGREEDYSNNRGKSASLFIILGLLGLVLLVGGAAVYIFYFKDKPATEEVLTTGTTEQKIPVEQTSLPENNESNPIDEPTSSEVQAEETTQEQPVEVASQPVGTSISSSDQGTNQYVEQRSGDYFIIVSSFIDEDLAKDFATKLNKEGLDTYILPPTRKKKYYRLGIEQSSTFQEANSKLTSTIKDKLGNDLWVLKY